MLSEGSLRVVSATRAAVLGPRSCRESSKVRAPLLERQGCMQGRPREIHTVLSRLLAGAPLNQAVPAFVQRSMRCDDSDRDFVDELLAFIDSDAVLPAETYSRIAFLHAAASELADSDPAPDSELHEVLEAWPTYPVPDREEWAHFRKPMLIMHGELDARVAKDSAALLARHYRAPNQTYVSFPAGSHELVGWTADRGGRDCAFELAIQFLSAPRRPHPTLCASQSAPLDFEGRAWAPHFTSMATFWD